MRTRAAALAVVPVMLLATACGNDKAEDDQAGSLPGIDVSGKFGDAPKIEVEDLKATDEPEHAVLIEGDGPKASPEHQTLVNLTVVSGVDGKSFFSTWENNQPATVGGGSQPLIPGLDEALKDVPRGSRIVFEASAEDVVGAEGLSQIGLKADDALVVVADVLSVQDPKPLTAPDGDASAPPAGTAALVEKDGNVTGFDWAKVGAKPKKLQVITLIEGDGPAIEKNRLVTFDYLGEVWEGTKPFDESYSKEPATFRVGSGGLIPAWDQGLIGVKEGSRVMIVAPPGDAYGDQANGDIPANSTLVFVIDVLGVDG